MKRELRIPSSFEYLQDVDSFVQEILEGCKVSLKNSGYINLSICESVTNAIFHGNKQDYNKWVTIFAEVKEDYLTVEVGDEGDGFNYHDLPDPTSLDNVKNEGGRGLFIISSFVDQVTFKKNGSIIQLKFKINRERQFLL